MNRKKSSAMEEKYESDSEFSMFRFLAAANLFLNNSDVKKQQPNDIKRKRRKAWREEIGMTVNPKNIQKVVKWSISDGWTNYRTAPALIGQSAPAK